MEGGSMTWLQWLQLVEIPALAALAYWVHALGRELSGYKLHVAETYASIAYLRDVENRLFAQLEKMDKKLDRLQSNQQIGR